MKFNLGLLVLFFSLNLAAKNAVSNGSAAKNAGEIASPVAQSTASHFKSSTINFLLGGQFRFEDGADQTRSLKTYSHLALSGTFKRDYWMLLELSTFKDQSGNASLRIEREITEYNVGAGYSLWRWNHLLSNNQWQIVFNVIGAGFLGQNKQTINTTLLGTTQNDSSVPEWSMGAGAVASLRLQYFIIEVDTRLMTSKSYEPQNVSTTSVRTGLSIPFE